MFNLRPTFDWRQSRPHVFLLSLFLKPRRCETITDGGWGEQWRGVLDEEPAATIDRFICEGMLRPATVTEAMEEFTAAKLKEALRERGAPVSGRKPELIERLFSIDPIACSEWTRDLAIYRCSELGSPIADACAKDRAERRAVAERDSFNALCRHDVGAAVRAMRAFEDTEVFDRYLVVSVGDQPVTPAIDQPVADQLSLLLPLHPGVLRSVAPVHLEPLRIAAGMMALWGENRAKRWLPEGFQNGTHMDNDVAARMLVFAASYQRKLQQLRELGFAQVKILGTKDNAHCASCKSIAGVYPIDGVPELPNPSCTCPIGCRCIVVTAGC